MAMLLVLGTIHQVSLMLTFGMGSSVIVALLAARSYGIEQ
jgi:hypothetical protein